MKNKNQHYVPQSYLRRFVDPTCESSRESHLWVIERGVPKPRRGVPRKEAAKNYYYTYVGSSGERDDSADDLLAALENAGIPVLRRLEEGLDPRKLTAQEKASASHLLAALAVRVPGFRSAVETFVERVAKLQLQTIASHEDVFATAVRRVREANGKEPGDISAARQFMLRGDYQIRVDPLWSLKQMLRLQPVGAQYAYNFSWRVLDAPAGVEFVASDRPFAMVSTVPQPRVYGLGAGWESPYMEATFPLGPRAALLISQHYLPGRELTTEAVVQEINRRTAVFATQVFATHPIEAEQLNLPADWDWWHPCSTSLDQEFFRLLNESDERSGEETDE